MKTLKLTIELVPSPAWNQNLRNILPKGAWEKIRREVIQKSGNRCTICGKIGNLNCHEVWKYYDGASYWKRNPSEVPVYAGTKGDKNHVQKLAGFLALCNLCHAVKHLGLTGLKKSGSSLYDRVVKHFLKVNNCSKEDFINHQKEAYKKFEKRSHFEWTLDLGNSNVK